MTKHSTSNFIPKVEKVPNLGMLLPYYAALTEDDLQSAEDLATDLFAAATMEERYDIANEIRVFCPATSSELLQLLVVDGLPTNKDRILFRDYLVYKKASNAEIKKLSQQLYDAVVAADEIEMLFDDIYHITR